MEHRRKFGLARGPMWSVILGCLLLSAGRLQAQSPYWPLAVGGRWELVSPVLPDPMVFEVAGESAGSYSVQWINPWIKGVVYGFRPSGDQILLTALDLGSGNNEVPGGLLYFDFSVRQGAKWKNFLGEFTLVSKTVTVASDSGTYNNCIHIRYRTNEGNNTDYFFANGVGIVQLGEGPAAFRLSTYTLKEARRRSDDSASAPAAAAVSPRAKSQGPLLVGMDVNSPPGNGNPSEFINWFRKTVEAGNRHIQASPLWNQLEPRTGQYDFNTVDNFFILAEMFDLPVYLNLRVIDTNNRVTPGFLGSRPFDDARVIEAFKKAIQALGSRAKGRVRWISIGNEVDVYLLDHPKEIPAYARLVRAVSGTVRAAFPNVLLTTSLTFGSLGQLKTTLKALVDLNDFYSFSYYPMNSDFTFREPSVVLSDIDRLMAAADDRPIFLQELGYPSGSSVKSSEAKQAEFVQRTFEALRKHRERIIAASFVWMTDLPEASVKQLTRSYRLPNSDRFADYLATLGYFDRQGRPKAAWKVLEKEARAMAKGQ